MTTPVANTNELRQKNSEYSGDDRDSVATKGHEKLVRPARSELPAYTGDIAIATESSDVL